MESEVEKLGLRSRIEEEALRLGFSAFGVAPAEICRHEEYLRKWVEEGCHGTMAWMEHTLEKRINPSLVLPEVRSLIMVAVNYFQEPPPRRGTIARYALGKDYHKLMQSRLKQLCRFLRETCGADVNRPYSDTGPVQEKGMAERAGIGWQGKHTNLIVPKLGNWTFLGVILTSLDLPIDRPGKDRCGRCTRCIDVCPTGAIVAPYQLDARRCISYLTIENKGPIPVELRPLIGDHLFGCDDCLAVCPWNRWARQANEQRFKPVDYPDLRAMLRWNTDAFNLHTEGTPIRRIKRSGWLRNVAVVLGNIGTEEDLPTLREAATDSDALISEHARWAIQEIETSNRTVNS